MSKKAPNHQKSFHMKGIIPSQVRHKPNIKSSAKAKNREKRTICHNRVCRFGINCKNSKCTFIHPFQKWCKYDDRCTKKDCPFKHSRSVHPASPQLKFLRQVLSYPESHKDFFENIRCELVSVIFQEEVISSLIEKLGHEFYIPSPNSLKDLLATWYEILKFRKKEPYELLASVYLYEDKDCFNEKLVSLMIAKQKRCKNKNCTYGLNCLRGCHLDEKLFDFSYLSGLKCSTEKENFKSWKPLSPYQGEMKSTIDDSFLLYPTHSPRPTFKFRNMPIRAAGIIFYVIEDGIKLLFRRQNQSQKNIMVYGDLGGKTEYLDNNPIDTACREAVEESMGKIFDVDDTSEICREKLDSLVQESFKSLYIKSSKYMLYFVELPLEVLYLPIDRFGDAEIMESGYHDPHSYHWVELDEIPTEQLHIRLAKVKFQKIFSNM